MYPDPDITENHIRIGLCDNIAFPRLTILRCRRLRPTEVWLRLRGSEAGAGFPRLRHRHRVMSQHCVRSLSHSSNLSIPLVFLVLKEPFISVKMPTSRNLGSTNRRITFRSKFTPFLCVCIFQSNMFKSLAY